MGLRLKHSCGWSDFNSKVTLDYLAEKYLDYWRMDNGWKVEVLQRKVFVDLGVEIGCHKGYHAKKKALQMLNGEASDQYKRVWDYAITVKKYNPGSSVLWITRFGSATYSTSCHIWRLARL
ncbi:hypothetical protein RND81_06G171200 [Saponaria officinalis]|uniref:Uncharacterized protein n=1 Tax=Saponaria officinalis TaxID=3572 RepID=A0AAW1KE11_SAPOF